MAATRQELEQALRNADAAGDHAAARTLAAALKNFSHPDVKKVQDEFAALPWYEQAGTAVNDMARLASNGITFGFRDKLAQYLGGGDPEAERAETEKAGIRAGVPGVMAEAGSQMLPLLAMPGMGAALSTSMPGSSSVLRGLASGAGGAIEGAGTGVLNALGHDEDVSSGAGWGALAGTIGQSLGGALSKVGNRAADWLDPNTARRTEDMLRAEKNAAYKEAEDEGVEYTSGTLRGLLQSLRDATTTAYPGRHDNVLAARREIANRLLPEGTNTASLSDIDAERQILRRDVVNSNDTAQSEMGSDMIQSMDDYLNSVSPRGVTSSSGDPEAGLEAMNRARRLNTRLRKTEELGEKMESAERAAERGRTESEAKRAKIGQILDRPKERGKYTPDEQEQMRAINRGFPGLDFLSKFAPGGGLTLYSMAPAVAAGAGMYQMGLPGIALGTIPTVVGAASKYARGAKMKGMVDDLMTLVSSGSKEAAARNKPISRAKQDRLAQLLMLLQQQGGE